jgi:hypothetical protein
MVVVEVTLEERIADEDDPVSVGELKRPGGADVEEEEPQKREFIHDEATPSWRSRYIELARDYTQPPADYNEQTSG